MSVTTSALLDRRPLTWTLAGSMLVVATGAAVAYYVGSPAPLPVEDEVVTATVPAGQSVYLGVFAPPPGFDRTVHVAGISVHTTSTSDVTVVPLLCRGGDIGVTVDPQGYCTEILEPTDQPLAAGDEIVLQVTGSDAAIAVVDPVRIAYREGLRWGTSEAGSGAEIRILPS